MTPLEILPGILRLAGIAVSRNAIMQTALPSSESRHALIEPKSNAPGEGTTPLPAHR
jgi:hypothetical protein